MKTVILENNQKIVSGRIINETDTEYTIKWSDDLVTIHDKPIHHEILDLQKELDRLDRAVEAGKELKRKEMILKGIKLSEVDPQVALDALLNDNWETLEMLSVKT